MPMNRWRQAVSVIAAVAVVAAMASAFTFAGGDDPPGGSAPKLDQAEREAIVTAAGQAFAKHVQAGGKAESPDAIDASFWGEAITRLKPIRVRNDRVNVAIVLSEKRGVEEGLYVLNPISSYLPRVGDRFARLSRLSTDKDRSLGTLYHYELLPKAK